VPLSRPSACACGVGPHLPGSRFQSGVEVRVPAQNIHHISGVTQTVTSIFQFFFFLQSDFAFTALTVDSVSLTSRYLRHQAPSGVLGRLLRNPLHGLSCAQCYPLHDF
jgi:hypothetical protein